VASKKPTKLDPEAPALNGHAVSHDDERTLRNVEEFELDGLTSDDEGDGEQTGFLRKHGHESDG